MLFTAAFFILFAAAAGTGIVRINLFRFGTYTGILLSCLLCVTQQLDSFVRSVATEAEHTGCIVAGVLQQYGKSAEMAVIVPSGNISLQLLNQLRGIAVGVGVFKFIDVLAPVKLTLDNDTFENTEKSRFFERRTSKVLY